MSSNQWHMALCKCMDHHIQLLHTAGMLSFSQCLKGVGALGQVRLSLTLPPASVLYGKARK